MCTHTRSRTYTCTPPTLLIGRLRAESLAALLKWAMRGPGHRHFRALASRQGCQGLAFLSAWVTRGRPRPSGAGCGACLQTGVSLWTCFAAKFKSKAIVGSSLVLADGSGLAKQRVGRGVLRCTCVALDWWAQPGPRGPCWRHQHKRPACALPHQRAAAKSILHFPGLSELFNPHRHQRRDVGHPGLCQASPPRAALSGRQGTRVLRPTQGQPEPWSGWAFGRHRFPRRSWAAEPAKLLHKRGLSSILRRRKTSW